MSNHLDTKRYIKSLAPVEALEMIERFKIPSPQAEVLKLVCVENKDLFSTMLTLERDYKIHLSIWQTGYRLAEGIEMFQRSLDKAKQSPNLLLPYLQDNLLFLLKIHHNFPFYIPFFLKQTSHSIYHNQ